MKQAQMYRMNAERGAELWSMQGDEEKEKDGCAEMWFACTWLAHTDDVVALCIAQQQSSC